MDWKQGGDIYNHTKHWIYRDYRAGDFDQYGKPDHLKKTFDYYSRLRYGGQFNNHFLEDGTYLKIRELAISYNLAERHLQNFLGGTVKGLKVSLVGRNLYTFTRYSGFDPETGLTDPDIPVNTSFDQAGKYPNFSTISASLELKF
jgi:hypothetical protein